MRLADLMRATAKTYSKGPLPIEAAQMSWRSLEDQLFPSLLFQLWQMAVVVMVFTTGS